MIATISRSIQREITRQLDVIVEGCAEIITIEELEEKIFHSLTGDRPLRIKQGIDPTAPDVHIGHMVPYRKMRQFQDFGHTGVLIIGDFTAQIGDPSGRSAERERLTHEQTRANAQSYTRQIFTIVRSDRAEVHHQTQWFSGLSLSDTLDLAGRFSVAQLLAHESFRNRMVPGKRLSLHELFYPLLQAQDSVEILADVELGGTDQKFNILCGRDLMRDEGMKPQVAILTPLLSGTDGRKMSKSFGNHIPVESTAAEKIGKIMSIPDSLIPEYSALAAGMCSLDIQAHSEGIGDGTSHPKDIKMEVAKATARQYHTETEVIDAISRFERTVSSGEIPPDIPNVPIDPEGEWIVALMKRHGLAKSSSDARRLIQQGGVSIDGVKITDPDYTVQLANSDDAVFKVGKLRYLRLIGT